MPRKTAPIRLGVPALVDCSIGTLATGGEAKGVVAVGEEAVGSSPSLGKQPAGMCGTLAMAIPRQHRP